MMDLQPVTAPHLDVFADFGSKMFVTPPVLWHLQVVPSPILPLPGAVEIGSATPPDMLVSCRRYRSLVLTHLYFTPSLSTPVSILARWNILI